MKLTIDITLNPLRKAQDVLHALLCCMAANRLQWVPIFEGIPYYLFKPAPVDDSIPVDTVDGYDFHQEEVLSAKYQNDKKEPDVIFARIFFSAVNEVQLLELETGGPWVSPDAECPDYEIPWREWSQTIYSIAKCLHQSLRAQETRGYYGESPDDPHFLFSEEGVS
jgi:hypothetical protein